MLIEPCDRFETPIDSLQKHKQNQDNETTTIHKDFISELPDELLCLVIKQFEWKDIVKTTLLSHRWSRLLPSFNYFKFSPLDLFPQAEDDGKPCTKQMATNIATTVARFLNFYQPPCMHCFDLSLCFKGNQADTIDECVCYALQKGAQRLRLTLCCNACQLKGHHPASKGEYVFRSMLLNGAKNSLKGLHLVACILDLGPNFSHQFRHLSDLSLNGVTLSQHDMQTMLLCLPKLVNLSLRRCALPEQLCIKSSLLLESLCISGCSGNLRKIEMPNVNLLSLEYTSPNITKVTFDSRGVRNLRSITYSVDITGSHSVLANLCDSLPNLRAVCLYIQSNICWAKPLKMNITTFVMVTSLNLCFVNEIEFCFSVLKVFPLLQKLCITTFNCPDGAEECRIRKSDRFEHRYLKEVIINCSCLAEFVLLFLEHASAVERLMILQNCDYCIYNPSCDKGEQQRRFEVLQRIPKNVSLTILQNRDYCSFY